MMNELKAKFAVDLLAAEVRRNPDIDREAARKTAIEDVEAISAHFGISAEKNIGLMQASLQNMEEALLLAQEKQRVLHNFFTAIIETREGSVRLMDDDFWKLARSVKAAMELTRAEVIAEAGKKTEVRFS